VRQSFQFSRGFAGQNGSLQLEGLADLLGVALPQQRRSDAGGRDQVLHHRRFRRVRLRKGRGAFELTEDDILAIGVFLRATNALENIRSSIALATDLQRASGRERIPEIVADTEDAIFVLTELEAPISPDAVSKLERALGEERDALDANTRRERNLALRQAIEHLQAADDLIVDRSATVAAR
jgi:hypothetical protein